MKILVLSLLRLGDVIQQKTLLEDLRRQHRGARIDVLVNPSALAAREAVDSVDGWIVFEREKFQKHLATAEVHLFAPVREVSELMDRLSAENYDLILNFTHSRLSAFLMEGIQAKNKEGLIAEGSRFRSFDNRWLRHHNERSGWKGLTPFHSVEILGAAFALKPQVTATRSGGHRILIQPFTSDTKKNWSIENWKNIVGKMKTELPSFIVTVLGAPFEAEKLLSHFDAEDVVIGGIGDVRDLLRDTALILTGDTSIKHLAAAEGVPLLEISLGSSDPSKTGPYTSNAVVLQSTVACAPCPHSGPCRKLSHECGEGASVVDVWNATKAIIQSGDIRPSSSLRVLRPLERGGEWILSSQDSEEAIFADLFEKKLWRTFLDERCDEATSIGTRFFASALPSNPEDQAKVIELIEREQCTLRELTAACSSHLASAARLCVTEGFDPAALKDLRRSFSNMVPASKRLRTHLQDVNAAGEMPFAHPLAFFGFARRAVEELETRTALRERWLQMIREKGARHDRDGNLPERGPQAP